MRRFAPLRSGGGLSLKLRLGLGAAVLGIGSSATAAILWFGMAQVAARLDTTLAIEQRMSGYATLSQQAATLLVVATEAVQSELAPDIRLSRITPVADQLRRTFTTLQASVAEAVVAAEELGLDQQSRYGTQSLGLARMEALLGTTMRALGSDETDRFRLRAHIDSFASNFDPLLNQAVNTEILARIDILAGIERLRQRLSLLALLIAGLSLLAVAVFQLGLVRPQFRRLDALREAARKIGQADFAVALPQDEGDEIGALFRETNRMAAALSDRQAEVTAEGQRLQDTIAARTGELREANAKLEQIDENRRRFFADVSHELRTPLTVILMEAQIGRQETGNPAFDTIEARATRLNRRIDDLLRVARSDSGQLQLDPGPVGLVDLVESAIAETRAEIDNAGLALTVDMGADAVLSCDRNWMRQVIVSLIRNAIRHARDGGVLRLVAGAGPGQIDIAVQDNGPGIRAEDQPRIFERFTKGQGGSVGFGIGLSLVRWVVEAHDGAVTLTSPVPRKAALGAAPGTKVGLRLPIRD